METFTICLVLALYAFALKLVGRRLGIIDPIVLVMGGLVLAVIPFIPPLTIDPKLALVIFLPPVLYQAAISLSWREFRHNLRSILILAVGLVLITATAVAGVAYWLVPGMTIASAFVLGAIVSPPDAVAATAVLGKLRVPKRIVSILEGESLINDATALVFYTFAVAAVVNGTFEASRALTDFIWVSVIGIGIGLAIGKLTVIIHRRIEDPQLEVLLSLTIPFVAYISAEQLHASGVLAVVAAGLLRGAYSGRVMSATTRLQVLTMWQIIVFTLNAIGFLLIGIELRTVLSALQDSGISSSDLALYASIICFTVIAVRFAVLFPAAWLPRALSPHFRERDPMPSLGTLTVMGWAGMRGIVSLVAVLALPVTTEVPYGLFPARDMILFLAYCVLIVTLVVQGSTLGWLARKLKVEAAACSPSHGRNIRARLRESGLEALRRWAEGKSETAIERLGQHYEHMLARLKAPNSDDRLEQMIERDARDYRELATAALRAERLMLMQMRRLGEIEDDLALELQQELDLHEILIGTERGVG